MKIGSKIIIKGYARKGQTKLDIIVDSKNNVINGGWKIKKIDDQTVRASFDSNLQYTLIGTIEITRNSIYLSEYYQEIFNQFKREHARKRERKENIESHD